MATETDIRLRSALDGNQRDREQMCRSIVALDQRYSEVTPRHPLGGPDGGRDIEFRLSDQTAVYGAVGFVNGANDSYEQLKAIKKKFGDDLISARAAKPDLTAFVFLTNVRLPMGEQSEMKRHAHGLGIGHCDILDRERLRIELDSPAGFFIRFQYLGIALSEAEQASFLSKYGEQVQQVVSTGFQRVERTLNRILFLQEASGEMGGLHFRFNLDKSYAADEIGHFRAFVSLFLKDVQRGVLSVWFGSTDKSNRFRTDLSDRGEERSGIGHGIATGAWEQHFKVPKDWQQELEASEDKSDDADDDESGVTTTLVNCSSGIGMDPVVAVGASYRNNDEFIRFRPGLRLLDLADASFLPIVNESLSSKIESIEVFAGGYRIAHIGRSDFKVDRSDFNAKDAEEFSEEELSDRWVRLRPSSFSSAFEISFDEATPTRMYEHDEVVFSRDP